jgi:hypothetical protein
MPTELVPPYWTGGPPYPPFPTDEGKHGLAILDWFAGHAIAGLMGSSLIDRSFFDSLAFLTPTALAASKDITSGQQAVIEVMTEWDWRSSGTMPPPNGKVGSSNGTWDSATTSLYFTAVDNHGIDRGALLSGIKPNDVIRIQRATDSTNYSEWVVNGEVTPTDNYFAVPVSSKEISGTASATTMTVVVVGQTPPSIVPPTPEQLSMIAYAVAGQMAELRESLEIEPKPVPTGRATTKTIPVKLSAAQRETIAHVSNSPPPAPEIPETA